MKTSLRPRSKLGLALFALTPALFPSLAQAHPGIPGHEHGFANGFAHPLSGMDHLLAMLAVGLWAAQRGGRARWLAPLAFLSVMTLGGVLGMTLAAPIPWLDQAIAASVLVMGIFIATTVRLPLGTAVGLIGLFALFHGYAHGVEMPATVSGWCYGAGFIVATAGLNLFGLGLGLTAQKIRSTPVIRCAGGIIAGCGAYLIFTA